ncbi:MAG: PilW family protein [Candidatus Brocadiia bacterium]
MIARRQERKQPKRRSAFTLVEMLVAVALGAIIMSVVVVAFSQGTAVFKHSRSTIDAMHNGHAAVKLIDDDLSELLKPSTESGAVFLGVDSGNSTSYRVDNNANGDFTDDYDEFDNTGGQEENGLEFFTTNGADGAEPWRVIYYVVPDTDSHADPTPYKLIRIQLPGYDGDNDDDSTDADPNASDLDEHFLLAAGTPGDVLEGVNSSEDSYTVAFGFRQFRVRYYLQSTDTWYQSWDSITGPTEQQNAGEPDIVEITMEIVGSEGGLQEEERNPLVIRRLVEIP